MLVVNTASKCGFTPQYQGLEELTQYDDRGLVVLGFPCDQFGDQEPGDEAEIAEFCARNYGVTFPMFAKVDVNGDDAHPLFQWLREEKGGLLGDKIKWNFTKFLVGRDGQVVSRYAPPPSPRSWPPTSRPRSPAGAYLPVTRRGTRWGHGRDHVVVLDHHAALHRARPRCRRRGRHRDLPGGRDRHRHRRRGVAPRPAGPRRHLLGDRLRPRRELVENVEEMASVEVHKVSDRTFLLHIGGKIEVTPRCR